MNELQHLLGDEHFARLIAVAGGSRITIPRNFGKPATGGRDTSVRLIRRFGEPLAVLLVFHFADSTIYVPKAGEAQPVNVGKLRRLARRGLTTRAIAKRLGCTTRTVEKHRARLKAQTKGTEG